MIFNENDIFPEPDERCSLFPEETPSYGKSEQTGTGNTISTD